MELALFVILTVLATTSAGPIQHSADSCAKTCTDTSKFGYVIGETYKYRYDSDIKTLVQGATKDHASIHMSATVQLEILSKCEISMQLKDVILAEYDPGDKIMKEVSSEFHSSLEKYPVRVSYQDGAIDNVCLTEVEPTWVINVKRGIISLVQNNMKDFSTNNTIIETDVSGICSTDYTVKESGYYSTTIRKSKNLLSCTDRHAYRTSVQSVPYTANSDVQSLPLLNSDLNCEHVIDKKSKFLKSVKCDETHMFRPFSQSNSGAVTHNTQTLNFVEITTGSNVPVTQIRSSVSLKFEHVGDRKNDKKTQTELTQKLEEICQKTKMGSRSETPRLFTDLVYIMKVSDKETLSAVYQMLKGNVFCLDNILRTRKFFLDGLPMTGTSASVQLMTELIITKVITGLEAEMWLTTLTFIKNPTEDMLVAVKSLINMNEIAEKALLSMGTLVHSYCDRNGNCDKNEVVNGIISAMSNKIGDGCRINKNNMKATLFALRGIGNAGFAIKAIPILETCLLTNTNPVEIQLSAIEAFRRVPCDANRTSLITIFTNKELDSEIRIAAYRSLMQCPSSSLINLVRKTLESEEVNQVGSYIWTHLTNLMETSDRHKQDIRALLENEKFKKEFDMDKRKFSRNYEGSIFVEKLNTGAKFEGDMIWSSKSFLPRSAMMNLTIDLFGHSVNILEFGGRIEGLEYFLELFFGPNGYFGKEEKSSADMQFPKNIREDKMSAIDKKFEAKMAEELRGSMYMRVFGNEMQYMNFIGIDSLMSSSSFNILDMLIKMAEDNDYTYSHSTMFLDSSFIVPTASGFPLNLTVNGSATLDLRIKGKMDLRSAPDITIAGLVQPSAAVQISSMMSVDAFVTRSGIKMVSTLNTNTALQGKLIVDTSGSVTATYENLQPKMEIIDIRSSFFTIHHDMEKEQEMIKENRQTNNFCSPQKLVTVVGLELCAEVSYPAASSKNDAPYFPLTGPFRAGVYLYNRDTHTSYQMHAKSQHNKESNIIHFTFDTPGSSIDRNLAIDFNLNKNDKSLSMSLKSPWQKAKMQGVITSGKNKMGVNGNLYVDGMSPWTVKAEINSNVKGNSTFEWSSNLEIQKDKKVYGNIKTIISFADGKQIDLEYGMEGILRNPFLAKLAIQNKPSSHGIQGSMSFVKDNEYSFAISLDKQNAKKKMQFIPLISIRTPTRELFAFGGSIAMEYSNNRMDIDLVLDKLFAKKVTLNGFLTQLDKTHNHGMYHTKMDFKSSTANFFLDAKIDNKNLRTITTNIDFNYAIRQYAKKDVKLVSKFANLGGLSLTKLNGNLNFEVKQNPEQNFKITGEVEHNNKLTQLDLNIKSGANLTDANNHIDMRFKMKRDFKGLRDIYTDIETNLTYLAKALNIQVKGSHKHDSRNVDSNIHVKYGTEIPLQTSLRIQSKSDSTWKINSDFMFSYYNSKFMANHTLDQLSDATYISSLGFQGNSFITKYKSDNGITSFDTKFMNQMQEMFKCMFKQNQESTIAHLSLDQAIMNHAVSLTLEAKAHPDNFTFNLMCPQRHVAMALQRKTENNVNFVDAYLQWNADKNPSDKLHMAFWLEPVSKEKFNGSMSLSYPNRTLILNVHHLWGAKYNTHVDFTWEPKRSINADSIIEFTGKSVVATVKVTTPFTNISNINVHLSHANNNEEYKSNADISWASESLLFESVVKKPITLKSLVAYVETKSSYRDYKTLRFEVDHKLSTSLASAAKFLWNKQSIDVKMNAQNTTADDKISFKGSVVVMNTFKSLEFKQADWEISHENNGKTFTTNSSFMVNKKKYYEVKSKIGHNPFQNQYESSGTVQVSITNRTSIALWNVALSQRSIVSTLSTKWGQNKEIKANLRANLDDTWIHMEFSTPFDVAREASVQFNFTNNGSKLDSKVNISFNGNTLGTAEVNYISGNVFKSVVVVSIPSLNVNSRFNASATAVERDKLTAMFEAMITPEIHLSVSASNQLSINDYQNVHQASIQLKSSFPNYENIRCSNEITKDNKMWSTVTVLEYGYSKALQLETKFMFERDEKRASALITTPFEILPRMQGGVNFIGYIDKFSSDAYLEVLPYLGKTSVDWIWDTSVGVAGKIRIDTPFPDYAHFQAKLNGSLDNYKSDIKMLVEHQHRNILTVEIKHAIGEIVTVSGKIASPIGKFDFSHNGDVQSFKCSALIENAKGRQNGIDITFTNGPKINGLIKILHNRKDITALFSHGGSSKKFDSHAEVKYNAENYFLGDLSFAVEDELSTDIKGSLRSQFISASEEFNAAFNFQGLLDRFNTHAEFSTSKGKSEADITFDITQNVKGSLTINSPMIMSIKTSFNHVFSNKAMQSKASVNYGGEDIFNIFAAFNAENSIAAEIQMKSPLSDDINISTTFNGKASNFILQASGSIGVKKANAEIASSIEYRNVQQTASFKATGIDDISAKLIHNGDINQLKSFAELNIGHSKHRLDVTFDNIKKTEGSMSLTTTLIEPVTANFYIQIQPRDFKSHAEYSIGNKKSELNVLYSNMSQFEGLVTLKSHLSPDIALRFTHSGVKNNFRSHAEISVDTDKAELDVNVNIERNINTSVQIKLPRHDDIIARYTHTGDLSAFMCHGEFAQGRSRWEGDANFNTKDGYSGQITLTPSVELKFEALTLSFEQKGRPSNFMCQADFAMGNRKSTVGLNYVIKQNVLTSKFSLTTPYFDQVAMNLKHSGEPKNFQSHLDVSFGDKKSESDVGFSVSNTGLATSFSMKSPYTEDITANFEASGQLNNFAAKNKITIKDKDSNINFLFQLLDNSVLLSFNIQSPFIVPVSINFKHLGELVKFTTHFDAMLNNEKTVMDVSINIKDNVTGRLSSQVSNYEASGSFGESDGQFNSQFKLTLDKQRFYSGMVKYDLNKIAMLSNFKSHISGFRDISAGFEYSGKPINFETSGFFAIESSKSVAAITMDLESYQDMNVTLMISSPYVPEISGAFSHKRTDSTWNCFTELIVDEVTWYGLSVSNAKSGNIITRAMELQTVISDFESIQFSDKWNMKTNGIDYNGELNIGMNKSTVEFTVIFDPKPSISFVIDSAYFPKIEANIDFDVSTKNFKGSSELKIDGERTGFIDVAINVQDKISASMSLDLPFASCRELNGQLTIDSDRTVVTMNAILTKEKRHMANINVQYDLQDRLFIKIALKSSQPHPLTVNYEILKEHAHFKSIGEINHNNAKLLTGHIELNVNENLYGDAALKTGIYATAAKISHNAVDKTMQAQAEIAIADKVWTAATAYNAMDNIDASFIVVIPEKDKISGAFSHIQNSDRKTTNIVLNLDKSNKIEYNMILITKPNFNGDFTLKTPLKGYEVSRLSISDAGIFPNKNSSADVSFANKALSLSVSVGKTDSTNAEIKLTTPFDGFRDMGATFFHKGIISDFQSSSKIRYNSGKAVEIGIQHRLASAEMQSSIYFKAPFTEKITVSTNCTGTFDNFVTRYEIAMGTDNRIISESSFKSAQQSMKIDSFITSTLHGKTSEQKISLRHEGSLEDFKTEVLLESLNNSIQFDASFQLNPVTRGSVALKTPFKDFKDLKMSFSHSKIHSMIWSSGEFQLAPSKIFGGNMKIEQVGLKRIVTSLELQTPFEGMEINNIMYEHSLTTDRIVCNVDIMLMKKKITGNLQMSRSPLSVDLFIQTPFKTMETIALKGNMNNIRGRYSSKIEASWNTRNSLVFDGTISTGNQQIEGIASLTTPFQALQQASLEISHRKHAKNSIEVLKINHNSRSVLDMQLEYDIWNEHKLAVLMVNAPRSMKITVDGDFTLNCVDLGMLANWNTQVPDSNMRIGAGYNIRSGQQLNFNFTMPGKVISFRGILNGRYSKSDVVWGFETTDKLGYEVTINDQDMKLKLVLPSRSLFFSGADKGKVKEASVMWDADIDPSKKVDIRSVVTAINNVITSDVKVTMLSLGKSVEVKSEMTVNVDHVVFDGKTRFSFSHDSSKDIELSSRVLDISEGGSTNYSLSFAVSHPWTSIDLKVNSHIGKSETSYSAGMGLEYMTVKQLRKTLQIGATVNKMKKTLNFDFLSPAKTISISGSAQMGETVRMSFVNVYDQKKPLTTVFIFDPNTRSMELISNYDLENPNSEYHILARYVNRSAVAAEAFHVVNKVQVTDILVTARLNNSHLLHSRLHWRPEMIQDLMVLRERKLRNYSSRLHEAVSEIEMEISNEIQQKLHRIWYAIEQEIGAEYVDGLKAVVMPMIDQGLLMFNSVAKLVQHQPYDIINSPRNIYNGFTDTKSQLEAVIKTYNGIQNDILGQLRGGVLQNFNYVYDQLDVVSRNIPGYMTNMASMSTIHVTDIIPIQMADQVDSALSRFIQSTIEKAITELQLEKSLQELEQFILKFLKSPITVYDPAHGEIQAEFSLPIPLKSLDVMPIEQYLEKMEALKSKLPTISVPSFLVDMTTEWLPPFTGVASINKSRHITTFDGYTYDLDSKCTFVLVKDYINGNFTIILSNKKDTTLTILQTGKPISINSLGEITVGRESVSLPFKQGIVLINKTSEYVITIKGDNHFTVQYDLSSDHIRVQISGWYFGKTGGLLGVYDNEQMNDLISPYNKILVDTNRFAKTWEVGTSSCR